MPAVAIMVFAAVTANPDCSSSGVAVGLHRAAAERLGLQFPPSLAPIAAAGAKNILLAPSWAQENLRSIRIAPNEDSVSDEDLRQVMREARERGLGVVLMPIVRLTAPASIHAWRGKLAPSDKDAWWRSYAQFLEHYALIAKESGAHTLVIGSELSSLSTREYRREWKRVAVIARRSFGGRLAYSANHDALDLVTPFEFVDVAGVSAYFPVATTSRPSADEVARAWRRIEARLLAFQRKVERPTILLELGYPSVDGAGMRPWDDRSGGPIDLEEQALLYRIAAVSIRKSRVIQGVYLWEWFGPGGRFDRSFMPAGKPAFSSVASALECRKYSPH